jgi:hypothetical protein
MTYAVIIIKPDSSVELRAWPKLPTLEELQTLVGGYIQELPYFTKLLHEEVSYTRGKAYADEHGFMKRLPINVPAARFWRLSCPKGDPSMMNLCGTVVFVAKVKEPKHDVEPS